MNHLRLYILAATLLSIFHSVSAQEIEWEYDDVYESCLAVKTDYYIFGHRKFLLFFLNGYIIRWLSLAVFIHCNKKG